MKDKTWLNSDLIEYLKKYSENQRDYVLDKILQSDLLRKFMDTTGGRLIINSIVHQISANVSEILNICVGKYDEDAIRQCALKINIAFDFMHQLATIAEEAEKHERAMAKN